MKTTNAKAINFKGAGVCEVKDGMLTITGIEIKIEDNGDVLVIKNDNNCFVGKECLNVAQNMTVINGKVVSSDCSVSEKKEKTVEKIKLVNKLNTVKISGACDMTIDGKLFDDDEVNIVLTGSGNIKVTNAVADTVKAKLSGIGDIVVSGNIRNIMQKNTGMGDIIFK